MASEAVYFLLAPSNAQTLKYLCIQNVIPLHSLSEAQMKAYLDTPQRGINSALWEQGKKNNPDPTTYVPVVKIGFLELEKKCMDQEQHAAKLQADMKDIMEEVTHLQHKQDLMNAAIRMTVSIHNNLTKRVLRLLSAQEIQRKRGIPFGTTEESLCNGLEYVHLQLEQQPVPYRR